MKVKANNKKSKMKGFKRKANIPKTRKELRKEKRKEKKARRQEYYTNRKKGGKFVLNPERNKNYEQSNKEEKKIKSSPKPIFKEIQKDKKDHLKLQKQMDKQRKEVLKQANIDEDRNIKQLGKQLGLNKRKAKSMPKSFTEDGLDYLLEVCDAENVKDLAAAEQNMLEADDEFEEDFTLMTGKKLDKIDESNEDSEIDETVSDEDSSGNESEDSKKGKYVLKKRKGRQTESEKVKKTKLETSDYNDSSDSDENFEKCNDSDSDDNDDNDYDDNNSNCSGETNQNKQSKDSDEEVNKQEDGVWEDIYGRLRRKDGSVINKAEKVEKYIPPAARIQSDTHNSKEKEEKINRLKKQLRGLINRLAESNMHSISNQIEQLYMNNSRNDMNESLTGLILDSLVSPVLAPERLLLENILLITILHANIGTEVGAHFLQTVVEKFHEWFNTNLEVENKLLDNTVYILAQMYNFKVFESRLLYEILDKLSNRFEEKDIECILLILKNVGFSLRKDDPMALKKLILDLQKKAGSVPDNIKDDARIKFMLDILLAIKNNNMSKIPNYDTSYAEHLKKLMKGLIRKGCYVTALNISLEDLLQADKRGKWWIVGSAWTGKTTEEETTNTRNSNTSNFSQNLLELARKQRMNTDTRRDIFCIIMSAEDYLEAFEKLLHLSLKNQQEREIIHVILHCCLQEKIFNPYYAVLAQKFCDYDRKFQMIIKYSIWDKLKALTDCSGNQISNLAKLLKHLFLEKGLPISVLKAVQFGELDKVNLRFIRQILLGILLCEDDENCQQVFQNVGQSEKLKMFRESLRLFIRHFVLRNLKSDAIPEENRNLLETRAKMVDKILSTNDKKIKL